MGIRWVHLGDESIEEVYLLSGLESVRGSVSSLVCTMSGLVALKPQFVCVCPDDRDCRTKDSMQFLHEDFSADGARLSTSKQFLNGEPFVGPFPSQEVVPPNGLLLFDQVLVSLCQMEVGCVRGGRELSGTGKCVDDVFE